MMVLYKNPTKSRRNKILKGNTLHGFARKDGASPKKQFKGIELTPTWKCQIWVGKFQFCNFEYLIQLHQTKKYANI